MFFVVICTATVSGLTGCLEDGSTSSKSSSSPSSVSTSSSGGGDCNYKDLVPSSVRKDAKCDVQANVQISNTDALLQSTIAACQKGEKSKADDYYNSTYKQSVSFTTDAVAVVCGSGSNSSGSNSSGSNSSGSNSSGSTVEGQSKPSYYNACVTVTNSTRSTKYGGQCEGPVQLSDGYCSTGDLVGQYTSKSECLTEAQTIINNLASR